MTQEPGLHSVDAFRQHYTAQESQEEQVDVGSSQSIEIQLYCEGNKRQ